LKDALAHGWQTKINSTKMIQKQNLEQVPQGWLPSEIFKGSANQIIKAQSAINIRNRTDEEIKQVLRLAMLMVGLRGSNMPTDEEKYVLLAFIKSNYGNQTPEEIAIAFEMAVAGKLNTDCKCYENFSCEYFGRIMNAYIEYARQETKNVKKPEPEIIKPVPTDDELKALAIANVNSYVKRIKLADQTGQKFEWTAGGLAHLYDYLVQYEIWKCPESDRVEISKRLRPKYNDFELWKAGCKAEAYKLFCHQLADMDMTLNENGEII
jgi:hypothetical protein